MSVEIVNQMLKLAENLSEAEKLLIIQRLQQQTQPQIKPMVRRLSPEEAQAQQQRHQFYQQWLQQHQQQYAGQWVVLAEQRFICAAPSSQAAWQAIENQGINKPFISYIEPLESLPFGGW